MNTKTFILAAVLLAGCGQQIQHGLDEGQANEIETLLHGSGIDAKKVKEGGRDAKWAIEVPDERAAAAIKLLADNDLPHQKAQGFGEVFGKGSMVPTAVEENALFIHALSGEISRTLSALDGVVTARVHVVATPAGPHSALRPATKPRASVLLKVRAGSAKSLEARKAEIQQLVAGSVEELDAQSVSVMVSELPPAPVVEAAPSVNPLRIGLIVALAVLALLAAGLTFAGLKLRQMRVRLATSDEPSEEVPAAVQKVTPPAARAA